MTSDSKLLDFEILDCSNCFFQIPGLPGGLDFIQMINVITLGRTLSALTFTEFAFPLNKPSDRTQSENRMVALSVIN